MATHQVIRFKVSKYTEKKGNGIVLEGFDFKLLPHILSFVAQTNGLSYLFQSIRSMPPLHSQYELPSKVEEVKSNDFLESLKTPKRTKKVYELFGISFPKQRSLMRHQGGRRANKHEAPMKSLSCNNKCKNSLSSRKKLQLFTHSLHTFISGFTLRLVCKNSIITVPAINLDYYYINSIIGNLTGFTALFFALSCYSCYLSTLSMLEHCLLWPNICI